MDTDVIILGGGVLGLSIAFHLAGMRRKVAVFERERLPGEHASGKNAGMFRQLYRNEHLTDWALRSRISWPAELRAAFRQTGSVILGRRSPGHHSTLFAERIVRRPEKSAAPAVTCATDGLLDSPTYVSALAKLCRERGVELRLREEILALEHSGGRWRAESASGVPHSAEQLVDASGAWLARVLAGYSPSLALDVGAYARHLFLVGGFPPGFMPERACGFYWDEEKNWYLRLWDRTTRLASLCDIVPAVPETFRPDPELKLRLSETLLEALPEIAAQLSIVRAWHCFRTYARDQLPVVGFDTEISGLFTLGAFGGFGMSVSFAAAEDAALALCGRGTIPAAFSPSRASQKRDLAKLAQPR